VARLGVRVRPCDTGIAHLPGQRPERSPDDVLIEPALEWREADIAHAVNAEFAETVADVLMRRTHLAFETRDHGVGASARVAARMGALLGWTDAGIRAATAEYAREAARIFGIND
jgi:glycerol-3-phosphate dehydrogenase